MNPAFRALYAGIVSARHQAPDGRVGLGVSRIRPALSHLVSHPKTFGRAQEPRALMQSLPLIGPLVRNQMSEGVEDPLWTAGDRGPQRRPRADQRCGAPSSRLPLSPNDDRASASDAYAWPTDRGTREPNRRAGRSYTSSGVRACSAAGAESHATLEAAGVEPEPRDFLSE